ILVGLGAAYLGYRQMHQRKTLEERRGEQEDKLFDLYDALTYREASDALFENVSTTFVPGVNREVSRVTKQIEKLRSVCRELQRLPRGRRVRAMQSPKHSVDQVGFNIELHDDQRLQWVPALAAHLRVAPQMGSNSVNLQLIIRGLDPVAGYATQVAPLADY